MPYCYTPLQEPDAIRLIVLRPSLDLQSPLDISLVSTTLSACNDDIIESYTALSYVWGDANDKRMISIDGKSLEITASLESALRYIRDEKRELRAWADGICINQRDLDERNTQVMIMGKIYEFARHTIIFRGESTTETNIAMDFLLRKERQPILLLQSGFLGNVAQLVAIGKNSDSAHNMSPTERPQQSEVEDCRNLLEEHILKRPWFARVWVLQELVLSVDPWLQIGTCRVRWRSFCDYTLGGAAPANPTAALRLLSGMNAARTRLGPPWLQQLFQLSVSSESPNAKDLERTPVDLMLQILSSRRGLGVSDPRDMIFAHLGMVRNDGKLARLPQADYRLSVSQIYTDFAIYCLRTIRNLSFLFHVGDRDPDSPIKGLPTWVPDWTSPAPSQQSSPPRVHMVWENTCIDLLYKLYPPTNALGCIGAVLDVITYITDDILPSLDLKFLYSQALQNCGAGCDSYKLTTNMIDQMESIVCLWCNTHGQLLQELPRWISSARQKYQDVFDDFVEAMETPEKMIECEEHNDAMFRGKGPSDDLNLITFAAIARNVHGLAIACAKRGALLLVPATTRIGDLLCYILEDSPAPCILRRTANTNVELDQFIISHFLPIQEALRIERLKDKATRSNKVRSQEASANIKLSRLGRSEASQLLVHRSELDKVEHFEFVSTGIFRALQEHEDVRLAPVSRSMFALH
ncbi:hypothetical protein EG329_011867 [Mollisiaceae sp. DMI_Dod_QoI]|nr:hypothetical protein EG329_011867 [Helotiales sp. DMI_Dod_QoI]